MVQTDLEAVQNVDCPYCNQRKGEWCINYRGLPTVRIHAGRREAHKLRELGAIHRTVLEVKPNFVPEIDMNWMNTILDED